MHSTERLHYMDNLRALAMLSGVVFHAALAYSPMLHPFFPTADRAQSVLVDVFAWFLHLFRMPLFFVVAGFFAAMLVAMRGMGGLFRNRFRRIVLPFLIFWPLLYWLTGLLVEEAALSVEHPAPLLAMVKNFLSMENPPSLPPSTMHLWFLYYLILFYVLVWCAGNFDLRAITGRLRRIPLSAGLLILPLLLVPGFLMVSAPHPAPESFLPQFWALLIFGGFFVAGYMLYSAPAQIDRLQRVAPWLLLGSVLLYALFLIALKQFPVNAEQPQAHWSQAICEAYVSVWMTAASLYYGKRLLNRSNAVLRYLADASYWTYLLHLPVLFAIQFQLMDRDWSWLTKFTLALTLTSLVCLLSYQLLVRHTLLGTLLNGPRR